MDFIKFLSVKKYEYLSGESLVFIRSNRRKDRQTWRSL